MYRVSGFLKFSANINRLFKIELFVTWYTELNEVLIESDQSVSSSEKVSWETNIIAIQRAKIEAKRLTFTVRNKMSKTTKCRKGPICTVNFSGRLFTEVVTLSANHSPTSKGSCVVFVMVCVTVA